MKFLFIFIFSFTTLAQLDLRNAPAPLFVADSYFVYVDFQRTHHDITYDVKEKRAYVRSTINFYMPINGHPIVDLVPEMTLSQIDGVDTIFPLYNIKNAQTVRVSRQKIEKGFHQLIIEHELEELVVFDRKGVTSALWMSDLSSRSFLEKYLTSSFEYDQLNLSIYVKILNSRNDYTIITNGHNLNVLPNEWSIEFPYFYTGSSVFFHLFPTQTKIIKSAVFTSIDGRQIPITVYKQASAGNAKRRVNNAINSSKQYFDELESLYGPWPHDFFIAYVAGTGGMEYSGATMTSHFALRHEMNHSYFARNVIPANGNAGWIDEAIATWADDGYRSYNSATPSGAASASDHSRVTNRSSYRKGSRFIGHLDYLLSSRDKNMKTFLKYYFDKRRESTILAIDFQDDAQEYFQRDLSQLFNKYIYRPTFSSLENNLYQHPLENSHIHYYTRDELYYHL